MKRTMQSLDWFEQNTEKIGYNYYSNYGVSQAVIPSMLRYCGKELELEKCVSVEGTFHIFDDIINSVIFFEEWMLVPLTPAEICDSESEDFRRGFNYCVELLKKFMDGKEILVNFVKKT